MNLRKGLLVIIALMAVLLPCAVHAANTVEVSYTLTDQGGGDYLYTFIFTNNGPDKDAIFKIIVNNIPSGWTEISANGPTGWTGSQNGGHLNFQTGNGSLSASSGTNRLFGQPGAPYGPGATSGTFTYQFHNSGSVIPTDDFFDLDDFVIHIQRIDSNWANNGASYTTTPTPEPSGLIALACGLTGLGGLMWKRRKASK